MSEKSQEERATDAINSLTSSLSDALLEGFNQLPKDLQLNVVMIKTVQLLLANVLCHVAHNKAEFDDIVTVQGAEITDLSYACANTAFAGKFGLNKH
jgi:hypothetical protein